MLVVLGAKTICFIGLSLTLVRCVQFCFTPQNTILNQPAVYQCSVDTEGVSITWTVNGSSSTSSFITNQNIVTEGVGTRNSKLTIPGDPTLNGTTVTCIGAGLVNGKGYFNTSSAVLYIQVVQVTFTPSHNSILNQLQPAVYHCSVDTDGVTIQWTVNGSSSTSSFITNQSIVTEGVGTQNSKLTIPGDPTLNGTTVTCIGAGVVNGKQYFNSSSAVLYIQGPPQAVNIMCTSVSKTLYVKCKWTVPYTIEGVKIAYYNVNITKDVQRLHNDSVTDTHYSYLSGTYTVSVAAVVGDSLEGEIDSWEVNVSKVIPVDYQCNVEVLKVDRNNTWKANYTLIMDTQFIIGLQPSQVYACFHLLPGSTVSEFDCEYYYETNINTPSRRKVVGTVDLEGMQDKQKGEITFFAEYETGLQVMSNGSCTASTFDLQRVDVSQDFIGKVCFQCFYVIGSSTRGCFIEYTCSVDGVYGNFSILKPDETKCLASKYFKDNCIVKAFDIESDGRVYSSETADKQTFSIKENEITRTRVSSDIYVLTSFPMALSSVIAATSVPETSKGNVALILSLSVCSSVIVIIAVTCIVVFIAVKMETSKKKGSLQVNNNELKAGA